MLSSAVNQFDCLFNPTSVAVIGANNEFGKWGFDLLQAIIESNSQLKVYPVNTRATEVCGIKSYRKVSDIPGDVDLAVVAIPRSNVPSAMRDCVDKGIKGAIIITGGFDETDDEGARLQDEITEICRDGGLRFIGPNTMGHFNMTSKFNTCPWIPGIKKGAVSFLSQSGNLGVLTLQQGIDEGIGFSKFVGTGNETDLHLEDFLQYLGQDDDTGVITIYIEGLREGQRFLNLAKEITPRKPIVALKAGRTAEGARASMSHTATLTGTDIAYDAMFKQAGVVRVEEAEELLGTAVALSRQPLPRGNRVGIITMGGGFGVVATDACQKMGLEVTPLSSGTIQKLNSILLPIWSHGNPVDMLGEHFISYDCLNAVLEDENVDAVLGIGVLATIRIIHERLKAFSATKREKISSMLMEREEEELDQLDAIIRRMDELQKPIIYCSGSPFLTRRGSKPHQKLRENNILLYPTPEAGIKVLAHLVEYSNYRHHR